MKTKQLFLAQILLLHAITGAMAANVTWLPSGGAGTSGSWSTASNWSTGGLPGSTDTVVLGDPGATTRTITFDTSLSKTVAGITFTAPVSGTSILDIQGSLTVNASLGIGANSMIYLETNSSSTQSPVYKGNLYVNSGGTLEMEATATRQTYVNGVVNLNSGGKINLEMGTGTSGASSYNLGVWGFNMSGGTLNVGVTPRNGAAGDATDNRIIVANSANTLNVTGGTVNISGTTWSLYLQSPTGTGTNYYNPTVQTGSFSQFVFYPSATGTQILVTNQVLPTLYVRTAGVNTVIKNTNTSTNGNIGTIQLANTGANLTTSLTLASNLTCTPGSGLPTPWGTAASGTVGLAIDTGAGYTLDITKCGNGTATFQPTSGGTANWIFQGSGSIKAYAFDLSKPWFSNVLGSVTLQSTGNAANNLGSNGGSISGSSTFLYSGSASAAAPATLTSNRAIGNLEVRSGALQITGTTLTAAGTVAVDIGATLNLTHYGIKTAGGLTVENGAKISMQITGTTAGTDYAQIVVTDAGGLVTLKTGSLLELTLNAGLTVGQFVTLIENESASIIDGSFSAVVIGGSTYDLTGSNAFTYNGQNYQLAYNVNADNGATGNDLELMAVPEPSTWAALAGGLAVLSLWRRRN